jgi:hypothetical protein
VKVPLRLPAEEPDVPADEPGSVDDPVVGAVDADTLAAWCGLRASSRTTSPPVAVVVSRTRRTADLLG